MSVLLLVWIGKFFGWRCSHYICRISSVQWKKISFLIIISAHTLYTLNKFMLNNIYICIYIYSICLCNVVRSMVWLIVIAVIILQDCETVSVYCTLYRFQVGHNLDFLIIWLTIFLLVISSSVGILILYFLFLCACWKTDRQAAAATSSSGSSSCSSLFLSLPFQIDHLTFCR